MSSMSLNDLADVTISNPTIDQKIAYDGTQWVNYYAKVLLTYDIFFQSKTITITQGLVTTTKTLPLDKTEILILVRNAGICEFSCTDSGVTYSTSVDVENSGEIYTAMLSLAQDTVPVTIYSAKGDTITYIDADNIEKTAVFDSNSASKTIAVVISPSGTAVTFTSLIAKDPNNVLNNYSKTVTITENTTDVYLMPDNTLYWFGYESSELEDCTTANGWSAPADNSLVAPVHQSNYIDIASSTNQVCAVANKTAIANHKKSHSIVKGTTVYADTYGNLMLTTNSNKVVQTFGDYIQTYDSSGIASYYKEIDISREIYVISACSLVRAHRLYALWYEQQ